MNADARGRAATAPLKLNSAPYDVERIRAEFPILSRLIHGKPLIFLAATKRNMPTSIAASIS